MTIFTFSGKGGTGKTTLSAMVVRYFVERRDVVLAFDMDPDAHLHKLLGLQLRNTIGQCVDVIHREKRLELEPRKPVDISDQEYFSSLVTNGVLIEGENVDLVTLGKPSSEIDCYCPAFYWAEYAVSDVVKGYRGVYQDIVIDCDPGTEIFPRKILNVIAENHKIDYLMIVLDSSLMSLDTAKDIVSEVKKSGLKVREVYAVGNRIDDQDTRELVIKYAKERCGIEVVGFVSTDSELSKVNLMGKSIFDISVESPAFSSLSEVIQRLHKSQ